ncbi:PREDICTED: U-box domain-containing protein 29 [Brassica oleracea var. oleracea]|uniref:U-box domain-containing protein n=1 Tax=Brassica oleracea var. oleracea TaxID=109376 RepID=A0A0D3CIS0_BRAOL|nr:PREDICTED: U-box domain-containing protein 29 [Brassica oleracea var. oleracea]
MGRDETETYITVPTFFKCPISLDVMRSPVSLCTGVTYDRPSIQRWLDGGNNTCPATMQILKSKDFVPNLTLQRLIKAWSDSVGSSAAASPDPASARGIPTKEEVNESLMRLSQEKDDEIRLEILSRIVRFVKDSEASREFLSGREDLVPMLVDIVSAVTTAKIKLAFIAIKILDTIIKKGNEGDRERLSKLMLLTNGGDCLTAILLAIQRGDLESKIEAVSVLEVISSYDAKSKMMIAEREGILTELIKSISTESDPNLMETSLSFMITISKSKRVRSKLIAAKTITKIKDILMTEETISVAVTEKSLKLLEILSSKREGRSEIFGGGCVEGVVKKLLKVSTTATEHAVTILWCLCHVFKEDKTVKETVERSNGVTKLLVVIQSNCSPMVRQMAKDLIKVLKVKSSASALAAYETKTTHIMPF